MLQRRVACAVAAGLLLAACVGGDEPGPGDGPVVIDVVGMDYSFVMPDTIAAGPTTFRFRGKGTEPHHMTILRLEEGRTLADVMAIPPQGPVPSWLVLMGGPNPPPADEVNLTTIDLVPGRYVVVCFIPSASDGMPHVAKGMSHEFTVVPAAHPGIMPATDLTLTLTDYDFSWSQPLTAGRHVVRVLNNAGQPHEVILLRLAAGHTMQDALGFIEGGMQGPPPFTFHGGTAAMSPGVENTFAITVTPGEYVLLCLVPDAGDGQVHAAHGMMQQVTVN